MVKNIIYFVSQIKFLDKDTKEGILGAGMAIGFPFMEFLTKFFQFLGAFGGVILLYFAIRHKILEIKKLEKDGRNIK